MLALPIWILGGGRIGHERADGVEARRSVGVHVAVDGRMYVRPPEENLPSQHACIVGLQHACIGGNQHACIGGNRHACTSMRAAVLPAVVSTLTVPNLAMAQRTTASSNAAGGSLAVHACVSSGMLDSPSADETSASVSSVSRKACRARSERDRSEIGARSPSRRPSVNEREGQAEDPSAVFTAK